jgi:hypothetical protein
VQIGLDNSEQISVVELMLVPEHTGIGLEGDPTEDRDNDDDNDDNDNFNEGMKDLRFAPAPEDTKRDFRFERCFLPFTVKKLGMQDLKTGMRALTVPPRRANTEGTGGRVVVGDCENDILGQRRSIGRRMRIVGGKENDEESYRHPAPTPKRSVALVHIHVHR